MPFKKMDMKYLVIALLLCSACHKESDCDANMRRYIELKKQQAELEQTVQYNGKRMEQARVAFLLSVLQHKLNECE